MLSDLSLEILVCFFGQIEPSQETGEPSLKFNWDGFCKYPTAKLVERSQVETEQLLTMLRFETRSKLEELPEIP